MWLLIAVAFLALVGGLGGAFAGGIFTIVLIPLAVIALLTAVVYSYFRGSASRAAGHGTSSRRPPAPPTAQQPSSTPAPSTPEELADSRRSNQ